MKTKLLIKTKVVPTVKDAALDIRELRSLAGLKQNEITKAVGIGRTRLSQAENGQAVITSEEYQRIVGVINDLTKERHAELAKKVHEFSASVEAS